MKKERLLHILPVSAALVLLWGMLVPPDAVYLRETVSDEFWLKKVFDAARYDIVVAGDSRVYRGVSPDDMAAALPGRRIFNYGFSSGILDGMMIAQAAKKLDPAGARTLVLAVTPHALTDKPNEALAEFLATPREERYTVLEGHGFLLFFHRMAPKRLLAMLRGEDIWTDMENYREHYDSRTGWVASSYQKEKGYAETLRSYRDMRKKFPVLPERVTELRSLVAGLRAEGIAVFFLYFPSSAEMRELERTWPGFDYAAIRRELESAGAVSLDDAVPSGLHSYDGSHLDGPSARTLSRSIGEALARAAGSGE
ncbi:MAG TPA: hypothetical protein PLV42_00355 [bacterium]|nr:hypothetical protein [bacterium]